MKANHARARTGICTRARVRTRTQTRACAMKYMHLCAHVRVPAHRMGCGRGQQERCWGGPGASHLPDCAQAVCPSIRRCPFRAPHACMHCDRLSAQNFQPDRPENNQSWPELLPFMLQATRSGNVAMHEAYKLDVISKAHFDKTTARLHLQNNCIEELQCLRCLAATSRTTRCFSCSALRPRRSAGRRADLCMR